MRLQCKRRRMFSSYFPEKSFFLTIMYKGTAKTANNATKIMVTKENATILKVTFIIKKINFTNIYATKIAITQDKIFFIFKPFNSVSINFSRQTKNTRNECYFNSKRTLLLPTKSHSFIIDSTSYLA